MLLVLQNVWQQEQQKADRSSGASKIKGGNIK